jgi:hypothetical protein
VLGGLGRSQMLWHGSSHRSVPASLNRVPNLPARSMQLLGLVSLALPPVAAPWTTVQGFMHHTHLLCSHTQIPAHAYTTITPAKLLQ